MTQTCIICGIIFSAERRATCSKACERALRKSYTGPEAGGWRGGKVQRTCIICEQAFLAKSGEVAAGRRKVCSRQCDNERKSRLRGTTSPLWKGGILLSRRLSENRRRVAMLLGPGVTQEDWAAALERFDHKCAWCRRPESEAPLTLDHIVALSRGGSHSADNIQPLCLSCNSRKKTRTIAFSPDGPAVEITDLLALARAVAAGEVPLQALKPNENFVQTKM